MPLRRPIPLPIAAGQESVWDYPRPPRLEAVPERLRVVFDGEAIAGTTSGWRVLETSHPPTYYLPPGRHPPQLSSRGRRWQLLRVEGARHLLRRRRAAQTGATGRLGLSGPDRALCAAITDHVAFYAGLMDACYVGDEQATPQPGGFYGGWVTVRIVGPFKGEPGTQSW